MSLANFFDKAALSASSFLKNFERQAFAQTLETKTIGVYFESEAIRNSEAKITLELSINLIARLYPRVKIEAVGAEGKAFRESLIRLARQINPDILIEDTLAEIDICLVVGTGSPSASVPKIYAGSDGWVAKISTKHSCTNGSSENPFGAAAAACLATANLFRFVFGNQLEASSLEDELNLSLIDLDPISTQPANPAIGPVDFAECCLVGLGAIGNGAVWTLRHFPNLQGSLHLIDHEAVELSNLQRYALSGQEDIGVAKVVLAERDWKSKGLSIHAHQSRWEDYVKDRGDWNINRVAVAVDSARDRCAIQGSLPRLIVNSWTRGGNIGISRHYFLGSHACLACLYLSNGQKKNEDELVAEAIGLPNASREIRELLYNNAPVSAHLLKRIAEAFSLDPASLSQFEKKPIRSFYSEAVCGGTLLRLTEGNSSGAVEVPMAFQSVFAGVLLAAEIVIDAGGLRKQAAPTMTQVDLLKPVGSYLSSPVMKDPLGRCICQDNDYITAYKAKYGE